MGHDFVILGNLLCLDLVNTTPRLRGELVDQLGGFTDLVAWLVETGTISKGEGRAALGRWEDTAEGERTLRRARALRSRLRAMVERVAAGDSPDEETVAAINSVLASRPAVLELVREGPKWASRERPTTSAADHLLFPAAASAAWLVEHGDPALLRKCENPACVLWFYDTTRNKRRRWCSMDTCGSRAKAAAYYRRSRGRGG